ncbi:GNAT family N-acetyltransferase [Bacillus sp. 1P06AnD]|uniref:GNAT family N-acetyltransferase n=1 Tax=Bacillus sp. 1P06AnD TaxID=3132208 RepID=UPI0039A0B556
MEIYQASIRDLDSIAPLFNDYRIFYGQPSDLPAARSFMKERLTNKDSIVYTVKLEGEHAGFVQLYPSFSSVSMKRLWILNDLYVSEAFRRKGVAERLINEAIKLARSTEAKELSLETACTNSQAQRLYEKIGFIKDDEHVYYSLPI